MGDLETRWVPTEVYSTEYEIREKDTMARQALQGHTSVETAYMIEDYPYGRKLRCKRRVWIERDAKHGFRFVAQTENPKNGRWNAPHRSTYIETSACLYLDTETGHVEWTGIGTYTDVKTAVQYAQDFGQACEGASDLYIWALMKARMLDKLASGEACFTMNGEKQERSETQRDEDKQEADMWRHVASLLTA
jgi:hypothetical protein